MKKYKMYGIGNALLDYEYKVNDKVLQDLKLDKGCMLLNDFDKHFNVHSSLKAIRPPEKIVPGGSVANSIYAMAQFDNNVCFSGKVSDDDTGNNFIDCLKGSGVESHINKTNEQKSGECLVLITPDNERTMNTYLGSSALLQDSDISKDMISESEYLLIEGYLVSSEETMSVSIKALDYAHEVGTKAVITLSDPNIVSFFRENMLKLFQNKSHITFCNEQEALNFSQAHNLKDAQIFLKTITDKYIITLGENGAICYDGQELVSIEGIKVNSKDFTGAGDMFLGAFMHSYDGSNTRQSLGFANFCASMVIQVYGAKLNHKDNYQKLKKDFKLGI